MKIIISKTLENFNDHSVGGIIILMIIIIGAILYASKLLKDIYGHRYQDVTKDKTKESKRKLSLNQAEEMKDRRWAMNYVVNHKDKFFRDHHAQFVKAVMDGIKYQKSKTS